MQVAHDAWLYGPWSPSIRLHIPCSLAGLESPLKRESAYRAHALWDGQVELDAGPRETRHTRWRGKRGGGGLGERGRGMADGAGGPAWVRAKARERGRGKGLAERWINYFTGDYVSEAQQRQALLLAQAQLKLNNINTHNNAHNTANNTISPHALALRAATSGLPPALKPLASQAPPSFVYVSYAGVSGSSMYKAHTASEAARCIHQKQDQDMRMHTCIYGV